MDTPAEEGPQHLDGTQILAAKTNLSSALHALLLVVLHYYFRIGYFSRFMAVCW